MEKHAYGPNFLKIVFFSTLSIFLHFMYVLMKKQSFLIKNGWNRWETDKLEIFFEKSSNYNLKFDIHRWPREG